MIARNWVALVALRFTSRESLRRVLARDWGGVLVALRFTSRESLRRVLARDWGGVLVALRFTSRESLRRVLARDWGGVLVALRFTSRESPGCTIAAESKRVCGRLDVPSRRNTCVSASAILLLPNSLRTETRIHRVPSPGKSAQHRRATPNSRQRCTTSVESGPASGRRKSSQFAQLVWISSPAIPLSASTSSALSRSVCWRVAVTR